MGRTLTPDDYAAGVPRAVVISDRLWHTRYGGDPAIVGRAIQIDGAAVPVVGVMPAGFAPARYQTVDLWLPYWAAPGEHDDRVTWRFTTLARLKPGVTFDEAHTEMDVISRRLAATYPKDYSDMDAVLVPVAGELIGTYGRLFYTLLGAVGVVLLVGCVNIANLMLARSSERQPELAIRTALGATRRRLAAHVLAESVLLSIGGALLGLVFARLALPAALSLLPPDHGVPRLNEVTLDRVVLGFTLGLSVAAGLVFALVPALRASQAPLNDALKEAGRSGGASRRARRLGNVLVVGEIALSVVLLVGAGLLLRSFVRLQAVASGFDADRVLAMQVTVPSHRYGAYETGGTNPGRGRLYQELAQQITELPGVQVAAMTGLLPFKHGVNPWSVSVEGRGATADAPQNDAARSLRTGLYPHGSVSIERVTPDYFRTLGVELIRGRLLDDRDIAGAPLVTVVNETFVKKIFPHEDPIGRRITADMTSYFPQLTIVGIVADNKMHGLDRDPYPLLYWPMAQFPSINGWLVVRSHGAPDTLATAVQAAVRRIDPDLAIAGVATMNAVIAGSVWRPRFATSLLGVFALVALALAAAGIYGTVSYTVSQRMHEMGLRITLGAVPRQILRLIVGQGAALAAAGVLLGVPSAVALRRVLASQLFGVSPSDPLTIVLVSALLLLVAVAAATIPALRAVRADPAISLRRP
jgi:putative ABC transport system permease protein